MMSWPSSDVSGDIDTDAVWSDADGMPAASSASISFRIAVELAASACTAVLPLVDTPNVNTAWFGVPVADPLPVTVIVCAACVGAESLLADVGSPTPTKATTAARPAPSAAMRSSFM